MILAEVSIKEEKGIHYTHAIRKLISEIIPIIFIVIVMFLICLLSVRILPPVELLFLIFVLAGILIAFVLPWFVKIHSKLQISLLKSLQKDKSETKDHH